MRPYLALGRAALRSSMQYKLSFALGMFGNLFQLVALLAVWRVLLADAPIGGFTEPQMRAYLLVAFTSGNLVSMFADFRMAYRIQSGLVSLDLVKPIDYQTARFAETLGGVFLELFTAAVVWLGVVLIVGGIPVPPPAQLTLFALSMLLVIPLKFLIVYLTGPACFWTQNYIGLVWTRLAVVSLLSGTLIPLAFLPDWLATTAAWLPFAGMASTPGLIFVGRLGAGEAVAAVALQLVWVALLWFGTRRTWRVAVRQLTVHGG